MTREELYDLWAPPGAQWSPWVKPVLFACMTSPPAVPPEPVPPELAKASWAPAVAAGAALVVDMPGASGVALGLALAARGYRPVPLYNAIPAPAIPPPSEPATQEHLPMAAVELHGAIAALWHGGSALQQLGLPADAPPAFLLDWNRHGRRRAMTAGQFDNRSVSFTTDFPSANTLLAHGIRRAVLVHSGPTPEHQTFSLPHEDQPQSDLAHTLRRWQDAGLELELRRLDQPATPIPLHVPKPSWFGWLCQRAIAALRLRCSASGGFGDWVPEASSAG